MYYISYEIRANFVNNNPLENGRNAKFVYILELDTSDSWRMKNFQVVKNTI